MQQEESSLMQKAKSSSSEVTILSSETGADIKTSSEKFTPSKKQIDAISLRLMPEIKKFFADKRTQKEFNDWKEKQETCK